MTKFRCSARVRIMCVLLLAATLGVASGAQAASADPAAMVPSNSLFCVRINNLDGALGKVDLFLTGLFPMGISMPVKAQLGQMLGSPQPVGIDTSGSFAVFSPLPGGAPDPTAFGILIPVSDYQKFVSGNPNVSAADATGVSQIGPAGSPMLAVTQVGQFALAGRVGMEAALAEAKKALSAGGSGLGATLDAAEGQRASGAAIWAYANIEAASQLFGPMIQAKLAEIKQGMAAAAEQGVDQMAAASASIDMYATMLQTLMNEGKYFSLSLDPSADKIGAGLVVAGKPGTAMAQMLQAGPATPSSGLLGYLDNGAVMNFVGSLDSPFWKKYNEMALGMVSQMMGSDASATDTEALKKMASDAMDCFSGSIAGSISANPTGEPPFEIRYVAGLKDTEKFHQVMESAAKMMNSGPIADFYQKMGMKISFDLKRKVDTYKGAEIDSVTFAMTSTDANSPQSQMINQIYGDGFNVQMAAVDGKLVYALSPEPGAAVRKLIDQVKAGDAGQAPGEVQTAMTLIPGAEKAGFFTTFNALRMLQMVSAFAPIPIPASNISSQSNMAIAGDTGDGKLTIQLAVPKQHVLEIMGLVMQMQMQQQQGMQQQSY